MLDDALTVFFSGWGGIGMDAAAVCKSSRVKLTASAASEVVFQILKKSGKGMVHSIFTNSFNVRCAGRLIHIGIIENGLAPFGIGLPRAEAVYMARRLGIGDQLVWHEATNTLIFTRGVSI